MKEKTKQMTSLIGTATTAACCLGLPVILSALSAIKFISVPLLIVPVAITSLAENQGNGAIAK